MQYQNDRSVKVQVMSAAERRSPSLVVAGIILALILLVGAFFSPRLFARSETAGVGASLSSVGVIASGEYAAAKHTAESAASALDAFHMAAASGSDDAVSKYLVAKYAAGAADGALSTFYAARMGSDITSAAVSGFGEYAAAKHTAESAASALDAFHMASASGSDDAVSKYLVAKYAAGAADSALSAYYAAK